MRVALMLIGGIITTALILGLLGLIYYQGHKRGPKGPGQ